MTSSLAPHGRQIGDVVDLLLHHRRKPRAELAVLLGISVKTLGRRINGTLGWSADEVAFLADYFDVPISALYAGPAELLKHGGAPTIQRWCGDSVPLAVAS